MRTLAIWLLFNCLTVIDRVVFAFRQCSAHSFPSIWMLIFWHVSNTITLSSASEVKENKPRRQSHCLFHQCLVNEASQNRSSWYGCAVSTTDECPQPPTIISNEEPITIYKPPCILGVIKHFIGNHRWIIGSPIVTTTNRPQPCWVLLGLAAEAPHQRVDQVRFAASRGWESQLSPRKCEE